MSAQYSHPKFDRVTPEQVAKAREFQSAILCDVFGRRGTLNARVQALHPKMQVAGPAFTVEVRPGDNLLFHVALALAQPGDVIIVDGKGDDNRRLHAGIDCFEPEPLGPGSPWLAAPNCVLTPHIGGTTSKAFRQMGVMAAQSILEHLAR